MWSNNDLMDANYKPTLDGFERSYNEWYQNFNGVPNAVNVRLFCHTYIKMLEQTLAISVETLEIIQNKSVTTNIMDLIHQRSIAFDEARMAQEKLKIAVEALEKLSNPIEIDSKYWGTIPLAEKNIAREALTKIKDVK